MHDHPVRAGDTWQYTPAFNGTMNASGIRADYQYTATDSFTYDKNGTVTVPAGSYECSHILHTGTSRLTFTMPMENKTVITVLEGTYSGDDWVMPENGFLVKSDYVWDTTTIFDTSSIMGDPLGLSMMGSTSHSSSSAVLQRK